MEFVERYLPGTTKLLFAFSCTLVALLGLLILNKFSSTAKTSGAAPFVLFIALSAFSIARVGGLIVKFAEPASRKAARKPLAVFVLDVFLAIAITRLI